MMSTSAKRKPWWNSGHDKPEESKESVESPPRAATSDVESSAKAETKTQPEGMTPMIDKVEVSIEVNESRKARASEPDVANLLSTSPAGRNRSLTPSARSPTAHGHGDEPGGSSDETSANEAILRTSKRRKLAHTEQRLKRKMAPKDAESRRSLKRIKRWHRGEPLTHNTVTHTVAEYHNLWTGLGHSWQRISMNCVYSMHSVNGWAEDFVTHKNVVEWPTRHKVLFSAWIDPRFATSAKYRRNPKLREIFNLPEDDEWIDSKLLSQTTESFREIELAIQKDLSNDATRRMRMARHYPVALALTDDLWAELLTKENWIERPYFGLLIINTVLDAILRLLRSEGLLTLDESPWFQNHFDLNPKDGSCILPTDGGGNADIDAVMAIINDMQLIKNYKVLFPDDPPIGFMDVLYWIRVAKRMEFRVCWMMPVATTEAAPSWDHSLKLTIPVRHPHSKRKGLNTVDYFNARVLSIAAWNGHADPKPDTIVHKTVRRIRNGTLVPENQVNWLG